jgi:hypothetical protein
MNELQMPRKSISDIFDGTYFLVYGVDIGMVEFLVTCLCEHFAEYLCCMFSPKGSMQSTLVIFPLGLKMLDFVYVWLIYLD